MTHIASALLAFTLLVQPMFGQAPDSLSSAPPDTTVVFRRVEMLGSIERTGDSTMAVTGRQMMWQDYITTPSLLALLPHAFLRDMGSPGQMSELTLNGLGQQDYAVLVDGRPVNDPILGTVNLNLIPSEYIERIEYRTGPDAAAYAMNGAGGVINIVTKSYDARHPYSKLRYIQGSFNHTVSDGILAQNVAKNVNIMLGFQHQGTDGRFVDSDENMWNTREKVRWTLSNRVTVEASHMFNKEKVGLNRGINLQQTLPANYFNERLATLTDTLAYEKQTRNDMALAFGMKLLPDSNDVTVLQGYASTLLREYRDGENSPVAGTPVTMANHRTLRFGLTLAQDIHFGDQAFAFKASIERLQIEKSYYALPGRTTMVFLSGRSTFKFFDLLKLGVFGAYQQNLSQAQPSYGTLEYGATGGIDLSDRVSLSASAGMGTRLPWPGELSWNDSLFMGSAGLQPSQHRTVEFRARFALDKTRLEASVQKRFLHNYPLLTRRSPGAPFVLTNTDEESITSATASLSTGWWDILIEADGSLYGASEALKDRLPSYSGRTGLYYFGNPVGSLELKLGFRANFSGATAPQTYDNYSSTFIPDLRPFTSFASATVDAMIIARIKSAIITVEWENVTDETYVIVPFYPKEGRNFRLGVSWSFLD